MLKQVNHLQKITLNAPFQLIRAFFCFLLFTLSSNVLAESTALEKQNQKLKQVQERIKQQRVAINKRIAEKNDLEATFKSAELQVAEIALKLTQTNNKLGAVNDKISALEKEQNTLTKQKKQHQSVLAELVKTAYLQGNHDYTKLLLNQDDPAKLERLIAYYQALNDARVNQLKDIQRVLSRLDEVEQELSYQRTELVELKSNQEQDKRELAISQKNRSASLRKLNARIRTDQQKLKQLQEDQARLAKAIEDAQRTAVKTPESLVGLYNLKKKLKWPTKGRINKRFGQRRSGALRWKGVLMSSELGSPVNSIAEGIVLYADWLKGFGWVTVVDHGKGYMSLYGHNQALLKSVGDFVEQDEPLALVGQSGGQSSPNLYFEIRYKGKTVDPARWCRR
ncbi:MAG: peptidoglycan DD-metalloendopeptidase family protein [Gammaproteobacteria bacterium]|nr:peptidoglycan DD-metalloendopeptidase family protein [Gammaproteobacteria bacterium]